MIKKSISIVAGSMNTAITLKGHLKEYVSYSDEIKLYATEENLPLSIKTELLIYSSDITFNELKELPIFIDAKEEIIAHRIIDFDKLDELVRLRNGEHVLVVNDLKETTVQIINHLRQIGLDDINYHPYYTEQTIDENITIAVTPGEADRVPSQIKTIINIGARIFDFTTITKILVSLDLLQEHVGLFSKRYLSKIIKITRRSMSYSEEVIILNDQLKLVMSGFEEGMLAFDETNKIRIVNEQFLIYFNLSNKNMIGRNLQRAISDSKIIDFCLGLCLESEKMFIVNNIKLAFTRSKLHSNLTTITIKNLDERLIENDRLKRQLIEKGHIAKYTFDNIIGSSQSIEEAKYIANRLAKSELTILIEGESGTGKELFASAIHNESLRREQAFLAINFSAFTDELIESELFGYTEGSFTGAKKGGKIGLFEQANGGTIFLDEIGDVSPKMQTKLLRVLQEGEILMVGGTIIKSIDVRIIAATNKNLEKMVAEGDFREDLYYRLKMGVIELPSLRERKSDIEPLIRYFLEENYEITKDTLNRLKEFLWKGNIRELKNTIEYMKAISDNSILTIKELPKQARKEKNIYNKLTNDEKYILEMILEINREGLPCGRQSICNRTYDHIGLSENQIRGRLHKLQEKGYIKIGKGKQGTVITQFGENILS